MFIPIKSRLKKDEVNLRNVGILCYFLVHNIQEPKNGQVLKYLGTKHVKYFQGSKNERVLKFLYKFFKLTRLVNCVLNFSL